jgi:hypothetical protein
MEYSQDKYIESVKGVLIEFIKANVPEADVVFAFPDITNTSLVLTKPAIYIEFERELPLDSGRGKSGRKRIRITYSIQVITTGTNTAAMIRDRIIEKVSKQVHSQYELLSGKGLRRSETKYVGSYRVRESINLGRLEFYSEIKFTK